MTTAEKNILIVSSSPNPDGSSSRALARRLADGLGDTARLTKVILRDVGVNPPPHLDQATIGAFYTPEADRSEEQRAKVALSDTLVDELFAADTIIIAAPMHNFGVSSSLKAWVDHIARVGRTFEPTGQGPKGLVTGRPVYIVTTRGGAYGPGTDFNHLDHLVPYLERAMNFIGLTEIQVIYAEATAKGDDGIKAAEAEIDAIAA
jgi:FMN-dependent NADH-azoreductase